MADDADFKEDSQVPAEKSDGEVVHQKLQPEQLLEVAKETNENTIAQDLTAANGYMQLGQYELAAKAIKRAAWRNKAFLKVLSNPQEPVPINQKYTGRPIIDLPSIEIEDAAA